MIDMSRKKVYGMRWSEIRDELERRGVVVYRMFLRVDENGEVHVEDVEYEVPEEVTAGAGP